MAGRRKKRMRKRGCESTTTVQTLLISKRYYSRKAACRWAREHDFECGKIDTTANYHRVRQIDPNEFCDGSFRTIPFKSTVKAVIGHKKR